MATRPLVSAHESTLIFTNSCASEGRGFNLFEDSAERSQEYAILSMKDLSPPILAFVPASQTLLNLHELVYGFAITRLARPLVLSRAKDAKPQSFVFNESGDPLQGRGAAFSQLFQLRC